MLIIRSNFNQLLNSSTLILFLLFVNANVFSQKIIGGRTTDASALLELQSINKGVLPPRLTTAERDAIVLPAKGLILYNSTLETLNINTGTAFTPNWEILAPTITVEDLLTSTSTSNALSANQGRILEDNKATNASVLTLDNTTIFVPSADFHPATKKYTDDNSITVEDLLTATNTSNALSTNQGRILMENKLENSNSLTDGDIFVGNASNTAIGVTLSGDATIATNGTLTIADNAVDGSDVSLANEAVGDIAYFDGTDWLRLAKGPSRYALTANASGLPYWKAPTPTTPLDYSTLEQDTGTRWVDGSIIYQRSFFEHTTSVLIPSGVKTIIKAQGMLSYLSNPIVNYSIPFYEDDTNVKGFIYVSGDTMIVGKGNHLGHFTGTVYYTK